MRSIARALSFGGSALLLSLLTACGASTTETPAPVAPAVPAAATPAPAPVHVRARVHLVARRRIRATGPGRRAWSGAMGTRIVTLVDPRRRVAVTGRAPVPRRLRTIVRFPLAPGPHPLVVFGHGFAVTPAPYRRLLEAWVRGGYVVAAPEFPLGRAGAPGGPDERDLVNQPADMSLVISGLLTANRVPGGALAHRIDPRRIAVAGQSDGGDTALAVAYDPRFADRRIGAAVILAGARIPMLGPFSFVAHAPPLLAVQGSADTVNPPRDTAAFFAAAPRPRFLLELPGAGHLPPYTDHEPQVAVVARASLAFLDRYLRGRRSALGVLHRAARGSRLARLTAEP